MNGDLIHNEMGLIKDFLPDQEQILNLNYIYDKSCTVVIFIKDKIQKVYFHSL